MASRAGHFEVAEFLLQNGAPVDAKAKVPHLHFCLSFRPSLVLIKQFLDRASSLTMKSRKVHGAMALFSPSSLLANVRN